MDSTLFISILALIISCVGTVATVAGLNDESRSRFVNWSKYAFKRTYKVFAILFVLIAIINGAIGVFIFYINTSDPTRKDIINLVLFLINIWIGFSGINRLIDSSTKK